MKHLRTTFLIGLTSFVLSLTAWGQVAASQDSGAPASVPHAQPPHKALGKPTPKPAAEQGMQDMKDMPGMDMKGAQPPSAHVDSAAKPADNEKPEEMADMPGMEGMEGMNHKMEPLPPLRLPKLGMLPEGASGGVVHLEELQQSALKNNPTLAQAATEVRSAAARRLQAGLLPNPTAGYLGEEIRGGSFGGGEQGFFVQQEVILGGKLGLNRKIFDQEVRQAEAEVEEQRLRVTNAVKIQFYQALTAQEMLAVRKELSRIAAETAQYDRQLFNIGQKNETEVLQAEIEAEQADLAVISTEHARRRAMRSLAAVVGSPSLQDAGLEGSIEPGEGQLNEQQLVEVLLRDSPAVRIAEAGVARAEAALARARKEAVPDLLFRGGLQQNRELQESTGRPVGLQGFAEVGVQLKLFNRNQGGVQAAQADVERSQGEVKRIQLVLRQQAAAFVEGYRTAQIMSERYKSAILPRAQKAYGLIYQRYGLMHASYPQVLMSEQMLYRMESEYIGTLERVWTNGIALQGFLLTDGLDSPARPSDVDRTVREVNLPSALAASQPQ